MPGKFERHYCVFLKATPVKKWTWRASSAAGGAGIARSYMLDGPGSIPGRSKGFFSSLKCQDRLIFNGYWSSIYLASRLRTGGLYLSSPDLHGVERDNSSFLNVTS